MHTSDWMVTNERSSNFFGSMIVEFTFVNILNSSATRRSYPYDDNPYDTTPCRTCFSQNGLIISASNAIFRIQRSLLIAISLLDFTSHCGFVSPLPASMGVPPPSWAHISSVLSS